MLKSSFSCYSLSKDLTRKKEKTNLLVANSNKINIYSTGFLVECACHVI